MSQPSIVRAFETYGAAPANDVPDVPAAITGGQSPTEDEHNALRTTVEELVDTLEALALLD